MKKPGGIYLVIDPAMERYELLNRLASALKGGIDILQIWNHWPENFIRQEKINRVKEILKLTSAYPVPVLINEEWDLLRETHLNGVHFDHIPSDWKDIREKIGKNKMIGFTAGNDPELIRWADTQEVDYFSFCAMFPSSSVDNCEIVRPETVLKAREMTDRPLFLSGGIRPGNLKLLKDLNFQGVAVISGIMNAENPGEKVKEYRRELNTVLSRVPG